MNIVNLRSSIVLSHSQFLCLFVRWYDMRNKLATCGYYNIVFWSFSLTACVWRMCFEINVPYVLSNVLSLSLFFSFLLCICVVFIFTFKFFLFFGPFSGHFVTLYQWASSKKREINDLFYKFCTQFWYLAFSLALAFFFFLSPNQSFLISVVFLTIHELNICYTPNV